MTPRQVFSGEFCQILKTPFLQSTSSDYFCSTEKICYQQNIEEHSEEREKTKTACKKNKYTGKTKT